MSTPRRSARLAAQKDGTSTPTNTLPKKPEAVVSTAAAQKQAERAKRKNRGLRRADTFFEYEGHPETRERLDNPFNKLMGKTIEIYFGTDRTWKRGRVVEFHAFDGLHLIEFDDKTKKFFNLGKKRYRFVTDNDDEVTPKKPKLKKEPTQKDDKEAQDDDEEEEDVDDDDTGIDFSDADTSSPTSATAATKTSSASTTTTSSTSTSTSASSSSMSVSSGVAKPTVDPDCGVTNAHVLVEGDLVYEAKLSYLDLKANSDKYYTIQVAESTDKSSYWCINHWGRTGTKGQFSVHPGSKDEAIEAFKAKFLEKAGIAFEDRDTATAVPGRYKYKKTVYAAAGSGRVMWQYYVDDFVDGKATGWYNYTETAANTVEGVYSEWRVNDWLDVRCVQSGYFQYRVDFNTMTQTNLRTGKCRRIRRVDEAGAPST
eukprot:m.24732 g.24732  ORF g.24732 m.24732 type:complete len:427 (+) comp9734_c0_seq1:79-1359(+)